MAINTYVCPNGHWWKERRANKVAKCLCGAEARKEQEDA
ncbi:hypothetical protein LCGC14_0382800 [marine sediment metagenome]|uniref:Uncharacterized protein n=1 Tax=marine sediment metagenome TaxID=412755 RepID=A0A0F9VPA4_9ZZZZ